MALKIAKITDTKTSEQFEALAVKAFEAGDLDQAAANLLSALELNDKNAALYLRLGVVFIQQGKSDKALIAIKRSLELGSTDADAYNAMGIVLFQLELWGAAERYFRHALSVDPMHAAAKRSLVEAMKRLREGDNPLPEGFDSVMALLEVKLPTLSLCMIAKNEEEFIGDCLASVKDLVDEIIVVDTGSTDRTIEIAERFGAKIYHFPWVGDFASARNESLKHATGDWILVLDADETIPSEWHAEVRKAIQNKDTIGYSMVIENLLGAKGESRQMALIFRLFQNRLDMRYEGIIHEQIIMAAQRTGMPLGGTQARIMHRGYLNQYLDQRDKYQRNLKILLDQEKQEPENPYAHFNLGQTYKLLNRYDDSERSFQRSLDLLKSQNVPHSVPYYANLYFSFVELYRVMGEFEKGLALVEEGIRCYPQYPDLLFSKGHLLLSMGRNEEAIRCFEGCRKHQGVIFAAGTDPSITTYKTSNAIGVANANQGKFALAKQHFQRAIQEWEYPDAELFTNLGIVHLQDGELGKAMENFTKALEVDEQYFRAWCNLGTICYKLERYPEAVSAWQKAREINPDAQDLDLLLGEVCLRMQRYSEAIDAYERSIEAAPDTSTARLNLGMARLGIGDLAAARMAWTALRDRVPSASGDALALLALSDVLEGGSLPEGFESDRAAELWVVALEHLFAAERYDLVGLAVDALGSATIPGLASGMGKLLCRQGLHEHALGFLLKAQVQSPEDPELYYLLGECAEASGNVEDAVVMFDAALGLNPRHSASRQKLAQLRNSSREISLKG